MIAMIASLVAVRAQTAYRVDILDPIGGAQDVNDAGVVVGGMFSGYRWEDGKIAKLPEALGDPTLINNQGDIVGSWYDLAASDVRATLRHGERLLMLPCLAGHRASRAWAMNALGTIVGESGRYPHGKPVKWSGHTVHELGLLEGDTFGYAAGINAFGQIVGVSRGSSANHPVFYGETMDRPTPLPLVEGMTGGDAWAINSAGVIVGRCLSGTKSSACVWKEGKVRLLERLPRQPESEAKDVNENGEIVGMCGPTVPLANDGLVAKEMRRSHAVLWHAGKVFDLNELVPGRDRRLFLFSAVAINNRGRIVGEGNLGEERVGYVLTPLGR